MSLIYLLYPPRPYTRRQPRPQSPAQYMAERSGAFVRSYPILRGFLAVLIGILLVFSILGLLEPIYRSLFAEPAPLPVQHRRELSPRERDVLHPVLFPASVTRQQLLRGEFGARRSS